MQFIAFIIIFGVIVLVHEFGHFYFAKKSGILVREFAIGMGPKIFAHVGKDGTAYTIRAHSFCIVPRKLTIWPVADERCFGAAASTLPATPLRPSLRSVLSDQPAQ